MFSLLDFFTKDDTFYLQSAIRVSDRERGGWKERERERGDGKRERER